MQRILWQNQRTFHPLRMEITYKNNKMVFVLNLSIFLKLSWLTEVMVNILLTLWGVHNQPNQSWIPDNCQLLWQITRHTHWLQSQSPERMCSAYIYEKKKTIWTRVEMAYPDVWDGNKLKLVRTSLIPRHKKPVTMKTRIAAHGSTITSRPGICWRAKNEGKPSSPPNINACNYAFNPLI